VSIERTQNAVGSHYIETKTYEIETSTSWDRGRDQDQLLWDHGGLETLLPWKWQ